MSHVTWRFTCMSHLRASQLSSHLCMSPYSHQQSGHPGHRHGGHHGHHRGQSVLFLRHSGWVWAAALQPDMSWLKCLVSTGTLWCVTAAWDKMHFRQMWTFLYFSVSTRWKCLISVRMKMKGSNLISSAGSDWFTWFKVVFSIHLCKRGSLWTCL